MSLVLTLGIAALIAGAFIHLCIVFPLIVLVACARSNTATGAERTAWLTFLVVFFPLGSWVYAISKPGRLAYRVSGWAALLSTAAVCVLAFRVSATAARELRERIDAGGALIASPGITAIEAQRRDIEASIAELKTEISGGLLAWDRNARDADLVDLLRREVQDKDLSAGDYQMWHERFESRHSETDGFTARVLRNAEGLIGAMLASREQ